jgi:ketopantoate reductase
MNIVILGAGALETVLGAHLAKAGEDVTLIARGNRAAYLQEHGATITGLVDFTVPVTVVTDPQQVQEAEGYDNHWNDHALRHISAPMIVTPQKGR